MFQKNIEKLKLKNPELAKKLEEINISDIKSIEVFKAESQDFIISYNGNLLHNAVDPIREAKTTWFRSVKNELRKNDIQIIFGLGMGYLFKRAYVSSNSKIFVYEPFIDILRFVLEYVDLSQELAEDRVYITNNYHDLTQKIQNEYLAGDKLEFLFLNVYVNFAQDDLLKLTNKVLEICESKSTDQNTILNQCKFWTKNTILNMANYSQVRPIGFLKESFRDKPALIISAGPSLADNLEKIKQNKDKYVIIAVCSAIRVLEENGIVPDFITYADSRFLYQHLDKLENYLEKVNLVINSRADHYIFSKNSKTKMMYFSETDSLAEWAEEATGTDIGLYKSGGTVSVLSYYFAKNLGCNPICFTGLDLAFIENKIYANGTQMQTQNGYLMGIPLDGVKKITSVKSVNGEMIPTRDDYLAFIRQFNEIFTEENINTKIINTSLSGAYIKGMEYMSFDKFVETIASNDNLTTEYIDSIIDEMSQNTQNKWVNANVSLYQKSKSITEHIRKLDCQANDIYLKLQEICELFDESADVSSVIQPKVEAIHQTLNQLRNEIINNPFLSNYLQNEILEYTRAYKTSLLPNIKDIKENMKTEMEFYKLICWATDNIIKWFEESFEKYGESIKTVSI